MALILSCKLMVSGAKIFEEKIDLILYTSDLKIVHLPAHLFIAGACRVFLRGGAWLSKRIFWFSRQ